MINGIGLSRRAIFGPLLAKSESYAVGSVLPKSPPPGQPAAPRGWAVAGDVVGRIKESLPQKSSGNSDVDFALVAAPVIEALVEIASERAAASSDPTVKALCNRISGTYINDLQSMINFLETHGHGE